MKDRLQERVNIPLRRVAGDDDLVADLWRFFNDEN